MGIKINKTKILRFLPFLITAAILVSFFVWQFKTNLSLTEELDSKRKEYKKTEAASRHLRNLEKQMSDIKQKQAVIYKKIPVNEKEPFSLIKTLIRLGGQAGLRNITLGLKEKSPEEEAALDQGVSTVAENPEGVSEEAPAEVSPESGQVSGEEPSVSVAQAGPSPIYLEMSFEGSFPQILSFLQKLMGLERIVKVAGISIQRRKDILPYQKASLDLVAYTYRR